jgi:hypothetical protein
VKKFKKLHQVFTSLNGSKKKWFNKMKKEKLTAKKVQQKTLTKMLKVALVLIVRH